MKLETIIAETAANAVINLYGREMQASDLNVQKTRKDFEGDFTLVIFPLTSFSRKSPELTANEIGNYLVENVSFIEKFSIVKGFLNLSIKISRWKEFFLDEILKLIQQDMSGETSKNSFVPYGFTQKQNAPPVIVEFSSPNTNKPLHLGHIRNNLLGDSLSKVLEANGKNVIKVNLINDRGIHICKSMLAWMKWGNSETPESAGMKGDHLVGKYYVMFDQHYKAQVRELIQTGMKAEEAEKKAPLILEAQEMLRKWELKDPEVISLWKTMNAWVYKGFEMTYNRMDITFHHTYHESETYLQGRKLVEEGVKQGVFSKRDDGSTWCDLTEDGLDQKLLLRADGTSVYITQDLGTAEARYEQYHPEKLIYVVGNEQNYHFDVLVRLLGKLGRKWASDIFHLSYGMVELPEGKMKSREGTVVDADDLLAEMYAVAKQTTEELGKNDGFSLEVADRLYWMLALGALRFFILKVDPRKNMMFNPRESIDFNGNTGPFIQYTHARIQSLLRKAGRKFETEAVASFVEIAEVNAIEKQIIKIIYEYPAVVAEAGSNYSPAVIANYVYELAKEYNHFYQEVPVVREENVSNLYFRLYLSYFTAQVIRSAMYLLGIEVPDKM